MDVEVWVVAAIIALPSMICLVISALCLKKIFSLLTLHKESHSSLSNQMVSYHKDVRDKIAILETEQRNTLSTFKKENGDKKKWNSLHEAFSYIKKEDNE